MTLCSCVNEDNGPDSVATLVKHIVSGETYKDKTFVVPISSINGVYKGWTHKPLLNKINFMMRSVLFEFFFAPPSWCSITDLEILKNAGRFNIDENSWIQLINPGRQINNVLTNKDICKKVAKEQDGSKKHHQVSLLVFKKVWLVTYSNSLCT